MTPTSLLPSLVAVLDDGAPEPLSLLPIVLGSGADATVYGLRTHSDFVVKLYHDASSDPNRQAKLDAMLRAVPGRVVTAFQGERVVELAWPEAVVASPNSDGVLGFIMPAVDLDAAVLLVELLSPRARRAAGISDDVRFRVTAAANLAASVAALHAKGHHVIDLKPSNLHVYRSSALIAILDCDGMSIQAPDGSRFPAHQYTDGTIAPEALRAKARPEELGEAQDRFALATVLFQLLNNGLHPFQGVPVRGATAPTTNGARIEAGLYPYGSGAHTLTPPPASPFPFLDPRTQALFARAFDSSPDARPSAAEWTTHLREVLKEVLMPCAGYPAHARYGDKLCATCELDPVLRKKRQRAAFAERREASPDFVWLEQKAKEQFDRLREASPDQKIVAGLLGFAALLSLIASCAIVLTAGSLTASDVVSPALGLQQAVESQSFREVQRALNSAEQRAIIDSGEPPQLGLYGPTFNFEQAWHADPRLTQVPRQGLPPLHQAALNGQPYILGLLLTRTDAVDAPDALSRTPLMYAATAPINPTLLSPSTGVEMTRRIEATFACHRGRRERQLERAYVSEPCPLVLDELAIGTVLSTPEGPDIARTYMPQPVAARALTLRQLVEAQPNVDAQDRWGRTPLAYAAQSGNGVALWQLLHAGADPNLADAAGITPLMIVADQVVSLPTDSLGLELASLLLSGGANAAQADRSGRIAADFVSSPQVVERSDGTGEFESSTLSLLDAASQPDWSPDVDWLQTARLPFPARQPDAENAADIGDWRTDFSTAESNALAATLPAPPWTTTLRVVCADVEPTRFEAQLELRRTSTFGIAEPGALLAPDWIGTAESSAEERTETPDIRDQRALEQRGRERCLARTKLSLPRRFDVRGIEQSTGPIWVEVRRPGA